MQVKDDLQKHTLFLRRGDYRTLQEHYPELGAAKIIRKLVENHITKLEAAGQTKQPHTGDINV